MKSRLSDLQKKIRWLETLIDTSLVFSSTLDLDTLVNLVLKKAEELMDAEASSVFRIDEERNDLYFLTARGEKGKKAKSIRVPMGKGVVGWVAQHGRPLLVSDVTKDKRFYRDVDKKTKFVTRSILAVPLTVRGKIIGVAEVLNKRGDSCFGKDDLELFRALGNQIAVAIENASLYRELDDLFLSSIKTIVEAIDAKDPYTRGHSAHVVSFSLAMAEALKMNKVDLKDLELSAILHDVGKIGIPDKILSKPGRLTKKEYILIKTHPRLGAEIIQPIAKLKRIIPNILHHHERYDGRGYPSGLKKDNIPFGARIICIADAFDAMTTDRPYRKRLTIEYAYQELEANRGTQFDPNLVPIFINIHKKLC